MHLPAGGNQKGCDDVVAGVVADFAQRDLGSGQDYRLRVSPQHEGERRGGIGHCVGTVQDDKAIVGVVVFGDHTSNFIPFQYRDIGGIQKRVHVNDIPIGHTIGIEFGDLFEKVVKSLSLRRIAMGSCNHSDGPAGEYDEYPFFGTHSFITPMWLFTLSLMLYRIPYYSVYHRQYIGARRRSVLTVSSSSGGSDNRAEGTEGLADDEGCINLTEGHSLLFEGTGPISTEYQVKLPIHVAVILIPSTAT